MKNLPVRCLWCKWEWKGSSAKIRSTMCPMCGSKNWDGKLNQVLEMRRLKRVLKREGYIKG